MSDLTVRQVAEEFQTSPATVRILIAAGDLPGAYKLRGSRGPWRVPPTAIDRYREQQQTANDPWVRTRPRKTGATR